MQILELWSTIGVVDSDLEQPFDGVEKLGDIYSERNFDGIVYFLFYLQTLSASKLVFKQDLSNCAQRVFTVILFLFLLFLFPRNAHQQASFRAFQGLMVLEKGFHHQIY
jgi:hypothetical protein